MTGAETLTGPDGPLASTEGGTAGHGVPSPANTSTAAQEAAQGTVYVIQVSEGRDLDDTWRDAGTVTVPKRSSLKTVFEAALIELQELRPTKAAPTVTLRAYQPEDVAEWEAVLEAPPAPEPQVVVRPRSS